LALRRRHVATAIIIIWNTTTTTTTAMLRQTPAGYGSVGENFELKTVENS
jgi:hypothetical protein